MSKTSKPEPQIEEIASGAWILKDANVVVVQSNTVTAPEFGGNDGKPLKIQIGEQQAEIWSWGKTNNLPNEREDLILENNIVGQLISTKRTVTLGNGLVFFRKKIVNGEEMREFVQEPEWFKQLRERMDMEDMMRRQANNLFKHSNIFLRFIRLEKVKGFHSVQVLDCRHVRAEKQAADGKIRNYFWCGDWKAKKREEFPIKKIPAYDPGAKKPQNEFILHLGDDLLTDNYYFVPMWWGGRKWIELANRIPIFHLSNLNHGYLIRYHVEIPKDYFYDRTAAQQATNNPDALKKVRQDESEARKKFMEKVNSLFAGEANAGRALFTEYEINRQIQKDYPGIKIHSIETDIKDEALLKLWQCSNDANIAAQGTHPAMAASQTQGKLSSGSEIQNANAIFIATQTPEPRRIMTKFYYVLRKEFEPTSDIEVGFRDIVVAQLNQEKTGMQEVAAAA